jgi:hypothetical protein
MTWEQTVQAKRAAREGTLETVLRSLPPDVAGPFNLEGLDGKTLLSKLAAGEISAETLTSRAIRK